MTIHAVSVADELDAFNAIVSEEDKATAFAGLSVDAKLTVLYRQQQEFQKYVRDIEAKASAMADPDKLMEMASKMLGGGFM